jgi:hypothetical protein
MLGIFRLFKWYKRMVNSPPLMTGWLNQQLRWVFRAHNFWLVDIDMNCILYFMYFENVCYVLWEYFITAQQPSNFNKLVTVVAIIIKIWKLAYFASSSRSISQPIYFPLTVFLQFVLFTFYAQSCAFNYSIHQNLSRGHRRLRPSSPPDSRLNKRIWVCVIMDVCVVGQISVLFMSVVNLYRLDGVESSNQQYMHYAYIQRRTSNHKS